MEKREKIKGYQFIFVVSLVVMCAMGLLGIFNFVGRTMNFVEVLRLETNNGGHVLWAISWYFSPQGLILSLLPLVVCFFSAMVFAYIISTNNPKHGEKIKKKIVDRMYFFSILSLVLLSFMVLGFIQLSPLGSRSFFSNNYILDAFFLAVFFMSLVFTIVCFGISIPLLIKTKKGKNLVYSEYEKKDEWSNK